MHADRDPGYGAARLHAAGQRGAVPQGSEELRQEFLAVRERIRKE